MPGEGAVLEATLTFDRQGMPASCADVFSGRIYAEVQESDGTFLEQLDLPCNDELSFTLTVPATDAEVRLASEPQVVAFEEEDRALQALFNQYVSEWTSLGAIADGDRFDEDFTLECEPVSDPASCDA